MTLGRGPAIIQGAHGNAAAHGAVLVAQAPPLDEVKPPNAEHTGRGIAQRSARGRPFQAGNEASRNRPPTLCRSVAAEASSEDVRRVMRRAETLRRRLVRELTVQLGDVRLTADVLAEIRAWARCVSWAAHHEARGDDTKAMSAAERASAHHLRARGLAERGLQRPAPTTPEQAQADIRARILGSNGRSP